MNEQFPLVDENGMVIGKATRSECHGGTLWLHPVVHLHVLNHKGELLLQKRSATKDIQPGKWDTSVGGHVSYGESVEEALKREVFEEIGIKNYQPIYLQRYVWQSAIEKELVNVFYTHYDGPFDVDPIEIETIRFWSMDDIEQQMGNNTFTPNFEHEFRLISSKLI